MTVFDLYYLILEVKHGVVASIPGRTYNVRYTRNTTLELTHCPAIVSQS